MSNMNITGQQFICGKRVASSPISFSSFNAATGAALPYSFFEATREEIALAVEAAAKAFEPFRQTACEQRAEFLETIAEELDMLGDDFVQLVMQESGLPEARVRGERVRTSNQMRLFARVLRRGDFWGARIDTALPERQPLPRPDIRQYRVPLGPVAVFGASNFPLAFSVAGGDTASALACGCPVVVKAHPGHPATSEMTARALVRAVERCRLPAGIFGMLFGDMIGAELVQAPGIKAVAFTGSRAGGEALCRLAEQRPDPIPVFAEMSGINPVIVFPEAMQRRGEQIASGLAGSATLGSGQFCTKPGLVVGFKGEPFDRFSHLLAAAFNEKEPAVMLSRKILRNYNDGVERLLTLPGVRLLAGGMIRDDRAAPSVFIADSSRLQDRERPLEQEVFGPATVLAGISDMNELMELLGGLQGQLTVSLFAEDGELKECQALLGVLEKRAGRVIFNDFPTGVEVCDAIVHGGPCPATSDSRYTSVGSMAMERFLRPVCYQGYPDALLPPPLQNANPLGIARLVNGEWSRAAIAQ